MMATSKIIKVPKSPKPTAKLCWETPPLDGSKGNPMIHCDRKDGHGEKHTWEYKDKWQLGDI